MRHIAGNRLTLLRCGEQYFPSLLGAIAAARSFIHLETYIYANDDMGERITQALCDASRRGVTVNLLVDGFGSHDMSPDHRTALRAAGVRLLVFRPEVARFRIRRHRLRRMHRKLAVIDESAAFIGGINVIDDYDPPFPGIPRLDYAVRVEGPLVLEILARARALWRRVAWAGLRGHWTAPAPVPQSPAHAGQQTAALVIRDSIRHRADIEHAYLEAIQSAREEILIANAYFFPGWRFRRALREAAARGVRVTLLLQGRIDNLLLHYASRALFGSLLEEGIEIFEYQKSLLHAKVAVFDTRLATVGSSNIDPFSLLLAREANLFIDDRPFATELRTRLMEDIESGAQRISRSRWRELPLWERIPIWIGFGLARLMLGISGYGNRL
jgi:cardiolipin synthase A/B